MSQAYVWLPTYEDRTAFLELGFDKEAGCLLVDLAPEIVAEIMRRQDRVAERTRSDDFEPFVNLNREAGSFGFGGLIVVEPLSEWLRLRTPLPVFERFGDGICSACAGLGKSEYNDECLYCEGCGKPKIFDHKPLQQVVASLSLIFDTAKFAHTKPDREGCVLQLFAPEVFSQPGACFVGGSATPVMAGWIFQQSNTTLPNEVEAMRTAHRAMNPISGIPSYLTRSFNAWVGDRGWMCADVPGDRSGIHPHHNHSHEVGRGQEFSCHNVDTALQALTLLVLFAALCQRARGEGVGIR